MRYVGLAALLSVLWLFLCFALPGCVSQSGGCDGCKGGKCCPTPRKCSVQVQCPCVGGGPCRCDACECSPCPRR